MKKTLIAVLALAGVATATSEPITLGSYYTVGGTTYCSVDEFNGKTETEIEKLVTGASEGTNTDYVNRFSATAGKTLTISTSDLYMFTGTAETGTELVLKSLQMTTEDNDTGIGTNFFAAITINGVEHKAYQSAISRTGGQVATFTYDFSNSPVVFKLGDTLTFSLNKDANTSGDASIPVFQGITGPLGATAANMNIWKASVKLNTVTVPEPATATLSLLALAGLAARRRRH